MAVDEIREVFGVVGDALHDAGHEVADDDHVGDADAEALDGNGEVEDDGGVGVGELREGEEGGGTAVEVSGASRLEVEAKGRGEGGPEDQDDAEHDAHVRQHKGHCQGACSYDCFMAMMWLAWGVCDSRWAVGGVSRSREGIHRTSINQIDDAAAARGFARVAGIFTAASLSSAVGERHRVSFNVARLGVERGGSARFPISICCRRKRASNRKKTIK